MDIVNGLVVKSLAGRDKGGYFVAVAAGDGFVYIADGKERRISKPKRKNLKHLMLTRRVIDLEGLTDRKLKRLLRELETQGSQEPARPDEMKGK